MLKRITIILFLPLLFTGFAQAQEVWSLEKCINHALNNSLSVKQTQVGVQQAELTKKGNKLSRLPSINANTNGGFNFGRTINPTTNAFVNVNQFGQSYSLSGSIPLYTGGLINNSIKQSDFDLSAAKADADEVANNISLNVATAYLSILFAEEQLANAQSRKVQTQEQLDQTDKLIKAGTRPQSDRLNIVAQLARDDQSIVAQENLVEQTYLDLKNFLELEPDYDFRIERPEINVPSSSELETLNFVDIYGQAINTQPQVRAGEMRMKSAELGINIARSNTLPTISLSGGLNTNFSDQGIDFENPIITSRTTRVALDNAFVGGVPTNVEFDNTSESVNFPDADYFTQLSSNFGQNIGFNVSIPIYNNHRNKIAIQRAELNIITTEITNKQVKQQLKSSVQLALSNARAAKKTYEASLRSVEALQDAYNNADKRFQLGAINTFEYTTSKNQLDQAKIDLIVAKYDFVFKLKVVDFYTGKPLKMD